jgi:hypothetical protein
VSGASFTAKEGENMGQGALFTFAELVQVIVVVCGLGVQAIFITWWLSRQLAKRDEAISTEGSKRTTLQLEIQQDIARIDLELATFKATVDTRLSMLPTRDAMEVMLAQRVGPMEGYLRTLVIELARLGLDVESRRAKG